MTSSTTSEHPQPASAPPGVSAAPGWRYLPALDGVRAIAVVAVVLFHYWPTVFPGGFIGVDIFFVLSGFLITSMLVVEHDSSRRIDLRSFWGRRVRRLVPAVVVLVSVCAIVIHLVGSGSPRAFVDSLGALTWSTNWIEVALGGTRLFTHNPNTVLDHLWSLAIEEQFYLVWPPVLLVVLRCCATRGRRLAVIAALFAASVVVMAVLDPLDAYFRTDSRAFELLGGALLAIWATRPRAGAASVLAAISLAGIVAYVVFADPNASWMYPWGFLGVVAITVALVAAAAAPPPWLGVLGRGWVAHLGRVSYGVYLWHLPLLRFLSPGRTHLGGIWLQMLRLGLLIVVVEVSFRFVETPLRSRRLRIRPGLVAIAALVVIASLIPLGTDAASQLDERWDLEVAPPAAVPGRAKVLVLGDPLATLVGSAADGSSAPLTVWHTSDLACSFVAGDSFFNGRQEIRNDEYCRKWELRWTHAVERFEPDVVVVASGYWDTMPQTIAGRRLGANSSELHQRYVSAVTHQLAAIRRARVPRAATLPVLLVSLPDLVPIVPEGLDDASLRAAVASYDRAIVEVARVDTAVTVLDGPADPADNAVWQRYGARQLVDAVNLAFRRR